MNFREDVFAKVITYITIAVLLGAMLVEAFVIYTERKEKEEIARNLDIAQDSINDLTQLNLDLMEEKKELQEFKDNWMDLVILADNELCQRLREDLSRRPELIPDQAIESSILAEEADMLVEGREDVPIYADFSFPDSAEKDWLVPLNLGNQPSAEFLFYARAVDEKRGRSIDILYEVPMDRENGELIRDENGLIIWKCMAYDAGLGWQTFTEDEEEDR